MVRVAVEAADEAGSRFASSTLHPSAREAATQPKKMARFIVARSPCLAHGFVIRGGYTTITRHPREDVQPALIAKTGLVGGIVIGAVVFALYHVFMGPSLVNLFGKVLFGIVLGALHGRGNSLIAPLLAHFAFWQIFGSL